MANVHYAPLAANDLYEISAFIARDKPEAALRWIERIEAACQRLADYAEMGEVRKLRLGECRSFSVGKYVILFRRVSDGAEIIRIVQGGRDIESF